MSLKEKLKESYEAALKKQELQAKTPNSPEAKKTARIGGLILFILGLAFALANALTWTLNGTIWKFALAAMITFLGLGLWGMITGKMPLKKR